MQGLLKKSQAEASLDKELENIKLAAKKKQ